MGLKGRADVTKRALETSQKLGALVGLSVSTTAVSTESTDWGEMKSSAVASESSAESVASEWTAVSWLDSEETNKELAAAILGQSFVAGGDELAAMRALGGSATLEDELTVRLAAAIGPLVARLAPRLRALATVEAATSGEMQTKFRRGSSMSLVMPRTLISTVK